MIKVPGFISESSDFVRKLLIVYCLGAAFILGLSLISLKLVEIRRQLAHTADDAARVVQSAFLVGSPALNSRQPLIEAYTRQEAAKSDIGLEVLFVLNREGRIVYSSRPAWLNLMIFDGVFRGSQLNNAYFEALSNCFRASRPDCVSLVANDFGWKNGTFMAARPISEPSNDLGLPRKPFLVVALYNGSVVLSTLMHEAVPLLLMAILLAAVLTLVLWVVLRGILLPRLSFVAQTDGLTKLMNRAFFMESAIEMLADAEERQEPLIFAIMDVDHFKQINDTYGHDCGDVALVSISAILATVIRDNDCVCRLGGEEFALLLYADQQSGRKVLERLRLQLEMNRVSYNGREIPVTVSIGAASVEECGYNLDFLYTSADRYLYLAKQGGRNRVEWAKSESVGRLQLDASDRVVAQASAPLTAVDNPVHD